MTARRRNLIVATVTLVVVGAIVVPPLAREARQWWVARQVARHDALIREHADRVGLPYALVRAVVEAESGGDPRAESPLGARGLMQVMPLTEADVRRLHPDLPSGNLYDADYNLRVGTLYLQHLDERFDGDVVLMLTAYHMGPTKVAKLRRQQPSLTPDQLLAKHGGPKTRAYVKKVRERYRTLSETPPT